MKKLKPKEMRKSLSGHTWSKRIWGLIPKVSETRPPLPYPHLFQNLELERRWKVGTGLSNQQRLQKLMTRTICECKTERQGLQMSLGESNTHVEPRVMQSWGGEDRLRKQQYNVLFAYYVSRIVSGYLHTVIHIISMVIPWADIILFYRWTNGDKWREKKKIKHPCTYTKVKVRDFYKL